MAQETLQKFGKYEILEELGRGAMGVVYKARDPLIGRMVALKTVMPGMLSDGDLLKRFYREAQSAGRLQHPNIVVIYDLGESDGLPYIAMELVEGESLQKLIARGVSLPLAAKLRILVQICRGLGYAHRNGVVHRDVKPANILVTPDGSVKVVDFGIVHLADTGMTSTGMILGTVSYMSPEQLRGEHVDARSDIFSVGILMYELLSGRKPFEGANVTAILLRIATGEPQLLSELVPGIPSALEDVVRKCLRKDPEERFQALEDLAFELEPLARDLQRGVVEDMVQQGRDFLAQNELTRAEEVLRNALVLDSSHGAAKSLMSKVQTELRRLKASGAIKQYLEEGQNLLEQAKYQEASRAFEEILRLDSHHGQARDLLQRAREAAARTEELRKRLSAAKRALAEGDLTLAESELRKALDIDREQAETAGLLEKIRTERYARERRLRLREGLNSARELLRQERYDEVLGQVLVLHTDFPEEAEVEQLLATIRQRIEQREQVQEAFNEVKALLEQEKFQEAIDRAETVRFRFPADTESTRLYDFAKTESGLAERRQRLELETTALQEQIKAQQYDAAIARGQRLQQEFPGSIELARLVMLAQSEKAAAERQAQIAAVRRSVDALRQAGRLVEAAGEAERAQERFPDDASLARLLRDLRDELARQSQANAAAPGAASATRVLGSSVPNLRGSGQFAAKPSSYPVPETPAHEESGSELKRKKRVPVAIAAAVLVLLLGGLVYRLATNSTPGTRPAVAGRVLDAAGAALAGVQVLATDRSGRTQRATSGVDGSFRFEGLRAGTYVVRAEPPAGYSPPPDATVEVSGAREQQINLSLSPVVTGAGAAAKPAEARTGIASQLSAATSATPLHRDVKPPARPATTQTPPRPETALGSGELVVTSNVDGAKILLDGQDSGEVTPHTFTGIKSGNHGVAAIKDGYETQLGYFQVPAGGSVTASLQLSPPSGMAELDTVPPGAEVEIDGQDYGKSPAQAKLSVGTHSYKVTLGTRTAEGTIEVRAQGFTQKKLTFPQ